MNKYSSKDSIVSNERAGLQTYMAQVYGWMCCGLFLTGLVSWFVASSDTLLSLLFSGRYTFLGLIIVQVLIVVALSGMVNRLSSGVATTLFMLYSMLTGVTISTIFLVYTFESIASTFFISAGTFAVMSIYGYTTKRDLTRMGSFLIMGLIGIVIASIANMFIKSTALMWVVSYIGVIVFIGLTAYDTQKLKSIGYQLEGADASTFRKYSILGALTLYLDFINLFLMLLRILGSRR